MAEAARRIGNARRFLLATALVGAVTGAGLATGPAAQAQTPAAVPQSVSPNRKTNGENWSDKNWGDSLLDNLSLSSGKNNPDKDPGSLTSLTAQIGAKAVWGTKDSSGRAITGKGVDVALLDTGISTDVKGLNGTGKVISGPDLSIEANSPGLVGGDNFGHGTHLAGIIGARDDVQVDKTGQPKPASSSDELGVAPDSRLVSVKLASRDGSTDVSQVIAGLEWITQHRNDNGMKIRVANLAYGTSSTQSYQLDPLTAAVENAWRNGIVVVVSGGNDGQAANGLSDPAVDPYVIAVGASDNRAAADGKKPVVASFSSRGTAARHVDVLAPGTSVASLRDPGSFVDATYPEGLVTGDTTGRLFRGSGTSQSAAAVSGAVALLLQAYPSLTPDQVKAILIHSATPISSAAVVDAGAGQIDVEAALKQAKLVAGLNALPANLNWLTTQTYPSATGFGSLELARGDSHLVDPDTGATLVGEVDVQGQPWVPRTWKAASAAGTPWTGGSWNGSVWTGDGFIGPRWTNAAWSGRTWSGVRWSDVSWDGVRWSGVRWSGVRWKDSSWL